MYDEHFGLTGRPFQLTPDPAFWYETATHRRAMAYLGYGLVQGEGFIVITGDIGAGKTTLVGHLLATLDREAVNPIRIVSSAIRATDLLRVVAAGLGIEPAGLDKAGLLAAIERGLHAVARTGRRTLVIVDEAQALPGDALEELRMLSNFQAGGHALLQIVLLGQPEFRDALRAAPGLEQLRQRVIATHHLEPMAEDEVAPYLAHRLGVVGWRGRPDFAADAFGAFHAASGGVPRRLNQLAGRVMLHAAVEGVDLIDAGVVALVAADLAMDLPVAVGASVPPVEASPAAAPEAAAGGSTEHEDSGDALAREPSSPEPAAMPRWMAIDEPLATVGSEPETPCPPMREPAREDLPDRAVAAASRPAPEAVEPSPALDAYATERQPFPPSVIPAQAGIHSALTGVGLDPRLRGDDTVSGAPGRIVEAGKPELAGHADDLGEAGAPRWLDASRAGEITAPIPDPAPPSTSAQPELGAVAAMLAAERFAALEQRLEEQDAALRRVLTLLVDWIERDADPRQAAAA